MHWLRLDQNPEQWPCVIDGALFAHPVSRHASTNYSPFYLMYNREPVLPVDLKYGLNSEPTSSYDSPFDQNMFEAVFSSANTIRVDIHEAAGRNMKKSQEKQKHDFDRRHLSSTNVKVGDRLLLENKRRHDRKGGRFSYRWLGPYTVKALNKNGLSSLESSKGIVLKQKYNSALLKPYIEYASEEANAPDRNNKERFDNVPDEKPRIEVVEQSIRGKNLWDILPDELVERILHCAIEISTYSVSDHKSQTYRIFYKLAVDSK